jgi:hypothetical protein
LHINKERQFDPLVVEAAAQLRKKWAEIRHDKQIADKR